MARNIHKSQIEIFVVAYLKSVKKTNILRSEKQFIDKAIKMIDFYRGVPCCTDPDAEVEFTHRDNQLTNFIRQTLSSTKLNNKQLLRVRKLLYDVLNKACCPETIFFGSVPGNAADGCILAFALTINGVDQAGSNFTTSTYVPQEAIDALNTFYTGIAVFALIADIGNGNTKITLAAPASSSQLGISLNC